MHSAQAYQTLAAELERIAALPASQLQKMVALALPARTVSVGGEDADLEFSVIWADTAHTQLRITGHLRGPSTWHHQHFQESITLSVDRGAESGA